jgi:hypothetical protein
MRFFLFLFISNLMFSQISLEELRIDFEKSINDKKICKKSLDNLEKITNKNDVYLAYYGAFQTVNANHVLNPINKLSYFNKGKNNIEKAIKNNPNDIDSRFLRYSIQKNCPKFLGYRTHLEEDLKFLKENLEKVTSQQLKKMILNILNKK